MPPVARDAEGFSRKERHFCMVYLSNGHNGAAAAIAAGYAAPSAATKACHLLNRVHIKTHIEKQLAGAYAGIDTSLRKTRETLVLLARQDVTETPLYQLQKERLEIDSKVERNIGKLLPSMTQEIKVMSDIIKNHNQSRIVALKVLADIEANTANSELLTRLQSLEAPQTRVLASETTLELTTGQLEALDETQ